jgi:ankyrin repeat protein
MLHSISGPAIPEARPENENALMLDGDGLDNPCYIPPRLTAIIQVAKDQLLIKDEKGMAYTIKRLDCREINELRRIKDIKDQTHLLQEAIFANNEEQISDALSHGADVNAILPGFEMSPFMLAIQTGRLAIVQKLLREARPNLDQRNPNDDRTPLILACDLIYNPDSTAEEKLENERIAHALLDAGANPRLTVRTSPETEASALEFAIQRGASEELVRKLGGQ